MAKKNKEEWKVRAGVFDEFTDRTLFKLITQGHFEGLVSQISIGKESSVFCAGGRGEKVIVKIYRLENCDFNKMYDYIKYDSRYSHLKKRKREIVFAWCQREFRNLLKAREAGAQVPKPIAFLHNVLVLEYIGDEEIAPKLKDKIPKNKKKFFNDIIKNIKKLHNAGMVHTDLSAFNILNYNEKPVFIDFSQCTLTKIPQATEYLERDVKNVCKFFNKYIKLDEEKLLKSIKIKAR